MNIFSNTENNEKLKFYMKYRYELNNYLNQYDYDWFCSINLKNYNVEDSEKLLKKWRCEMSTQDHIQISYLGVIVLSRYTGSHIHLLMSGHNKHNDTLLNRNEKDWEDKWNHMTGKNSHIERVLNNGVVNYITKIKNTPTDHFEFINPYNVKLLEKYRRLN